MAKLVNYLNLSNGVGLHSSHGFSPSSLVNIQIRLINQSEQSTLLIKAKASEMINKQIWFPGPLSLDNMVGETRSELPYLPVYNAHFFSKI